MFTTKHKSKSKFSFCKPSIYKSDMVNKEIISSDKKNNDDDEPILNVKEKVLKIENLQNKNNIIVPPNNKLIFTNKYK